MPPQNEPAPKVEANPLQPTQNNSNKEWKLEESSLWWLSLDFFQNPGNFFLITSVPFFMGAYYGYLQPAERLEEWVGDPVQTQPVDKRDIPKEQVSSTGKRSAVRAIERESQTVAARQLGFQMASRALGLATLGTLGTFSILGAAGFYVSGYRSIGEAMTATRRWASSNRESFEDWFGTDNRQSQRHPDVVATKNMTEEEQIDFVYNQILKEVEETPKK